MACPDLEDLLNGGNEGHAAKCQECGQLLDALSHVDATLDAAFAHISAPPGLAAAVQARLGQAFPKRAPSPIPEVLDLIGWAAVLTIVAIVASRFAPLFSSIFAGLD